MRKKKLTNAQRGSAFERRVKRKLEKAGYFVVRAGGSQGAADLVAIRKAHPDGPCLEAAQVALIQCKFNGRFDSGEWVDLWLLAEATSCRAVLASSVPYGGTTRIKLWHIYGAKLAHQRMDRQPVLEWKP